jgi:hypothetical protein
MLLALGIIALVVVIFGVVAAISMAGRQAADNEDRSPNSIPSDFVAPVSSGGHRWRNVDESVEEFRARVAQENASIAAAAGSPHRVLPSNRKK